MKKYILITLSIVVVALIGTYLFAIQGDSSPKKDISWLTKTPIAHKGLHSADIPENSIKAFKKAIEKGYIIELDVLLTKDKEVVVFHDNNLERLTGDKRDLKDVNYDEVKNLKLKGTNETIPTLKEVLEFVDNQVPLLIEIKNVKEATEIAQRTYNLTKDYKGTYAIQSFNPFTLEWFKNNASEVTRGQISSAFKREDGVGLKGYEKFILKNLLLNFKSRPHVIGYRLDDIDTLSVKLLKGKLPVISWTITNKDEMVKGYEKSDNIVFDNILP